MIKLLDLLNESMYLGNLKDEWYPAHTKDALSWTLTQDYVPLYPKTMEKVIGKIPIESFHVTEPYHIKTLNDVLGKKKSISTFTKANNSSPLAKGKGIQTGGGVIFHVSGELLAQKYIDFDTMPDRTGRRWVRGFHIFDGDHMIVKTAIKKAKLHDYGSWKDLEWEMEKKHSMVDYKDYDAYNAAIKKELGVHAAKQIKKYIDTTNKLLKKYKDDVIKSIAKPSKKTTAWWNEILIYNVKVKDVFVLKEVWDEIEESHKKELLKYVPKNKITIGSPAQFRKWYNERDGEITLDDQ